MQSRWCQGENVKDIRDRHNVEVWIEDPRGNSSTCRPSTVTISLRARVTVSGPTEQAVKAARDELEIITAWDFRDGYNVLHDLLAS